MEALSQGIVEEDQREGQDDQVVGVRALKIKGDLQNEQDKVERGVEVDWRGDKLCGDGESLLLELPFSKIQVPWLDGRKFFRIRRTASIYFVCAI